MPKFVPGMKGGKDSGGDGGGGGKFPAFLKHKKKVNRGKKARMKDRMKGRARSQADAMTAEENEVNSPS